MQCGAFGTTPDSTFGLLGKAFSHACTSCAVGGQSASICPSACRIGTSTRSVNLFDRPNHSLWPWSTSSNDISVPRLLFDLYIAGSHSFSSTGPSIIASFASGGKLKRAGLDFGKFECRSSPGGWEGGVKPHPDMTSPPRTYRLGLPFLVSKACMPEAIIAGGVAIECVRSTIHVAPHEPAYFSKSIGRTRS